MRNAVNLPNLDAQTFAVVKPFLTLGEKLGRLLAQLAPKRNDRIEITYGGKAQQWPTDPITRSVLKGFLELAGGKDVNQVNVRALAAAPGPGSRRKSNRAKQTDFNEWLHVAVFSGDRTNLRRRQRLRGQEPAAHRPAQQPARWRSSPKASCF